MRWRPREPATLRALGTASVACVVLAVGCGDTADPFDLPEGTSSSTSNSIDEKPPSASTNPNGTGSTSPTEPTGTGTDSTAPDDLGADDNVSIGPVFMPSPIEFGPVTIGATKTLRIGLVNNTDWQLGRPGFAFTIVALPLTGDGFTLTGNSCIGIRLEVGDACQIAIAFHPDALGEYRSILGLSTSPPVPSNQAASFRGIGAPQIASPSESPVGPSPGDPTVKGNGGSSETSSPSSPPAVTPSETPVGPSPGDPTVKGNGSSSGTSSPSSATPAPPP